MNKRLSGRLGYKAVIKSLQRHFQKSMVVPCSSNHNIFYMLTQHDNSIGYRSGKKVYLNEGAWDKIAVLVKRETGFDLLIDSPDHSTVKDRLSNNLEDKTLPSKAVDGFVMCRLIGSPYEIGAATFDFAQTATPANTYLGLHIDCIKQWEVSAVIVVENFSAFMAFDSDYLDKLASSKIFSTVLVIYRGYDKQNIYGVATELAKTNSAKYVFPDYDLSGLSLAEAIASRINATGYILPLNAQSESRLVGLSKPEEYNRQSATIIHDHALLPSYKDIKRRFIAITQDAIMTHNIPVAIINRHSKIA